MVREFVEKKERKVEYIELIYDLIFVYFIGRSNSLLHHFEGGFVETEALAVYALSTLAIIQIWTLSTYYMNMYGRKSVREHVFLFINMFLLYILAVCIRGNWREYHTVCHIAWALILLNIAVQYIIELRYHKDDPEHSARIRNMIIILMGETLMVAFAIPEFNMWGTSTLSCAALPVSVAAIGLTGRNKPSEAVDFEHLTERAMLFIVFTFGEMIIAVASYFEDGFDIRSLYFALAAFLIVVGLFLSYGVFYDRVVDRSLSTNGLGYMLIHIFLIFALNNITAALEFMREEEVSLMPKIIFLIGSFIAFYICLFTMGIYAKRRCRFGLRFYLIIAALCAVFTALMIPLREEMMINIAISVTFVFSIFFILRYTSIKLNKE